MIAVEQLDDRRRLARPSPRPRAWKLSLFPLHENRGERATHQRRPRSQTVNPAAAREVRKRQIVAKLSRYANTIRLTLRGYFPLPTRWSSLLCDSGVNSGVNGCVGSVFIFGRPPAWRFLRSRCNSSYRSATLTATNCGSPRLPPMPSSPTSNQGLRMPLPGPSGQIRTISAQSAPASRWADHSYCPHRRLPPCRRRSIAFGCPQRVPAPPLVQAGFYFKPVHLPPPIAVMRSRTAAPLRS
jgi:hypothetical protein